MLLLSAWLRLLVAGVAVATLWAAVLWVASSTPSISPDAPPVRIAIAAPAVPIPPTGELRVLIRSGAPTPVGGHFDRFDVAAQPIAAPVNARGQVAFYASVLRSPAREGIFLAEHGHVSKLAAFGDSVPGGGVLAEFGGHPLPSLNAVGHAAFLAHLAGRSTEGVFLSGRDGLQAVALAGDDAPGLPGGVFVGFDAPSLNDNDELAFVASVRRGRDMLDVLYFWNGNRLQRVVGEGERLLRIGGTMEKIGGPTLNNAGVIAFPASLFRGPVLGGIFIAGARELRLLIGTGERVPSGHMIQRFSERVAVDDEGAISFGSQLGEGGKTREAVLRIGTDGLAEIAVEGSPAPGGGRYAGFGPWPTVAPGGMSAFIAALDGGPGPLAAFAGAPGEIDRIATAGETLPSGERIGRFALNTIAMAGPNGMLTFATATQGTEERSAIYCICPVPTR